MNKAVGACTRNVDKHRPIHPEYAASILDQVAATDAVFTADTGMCNVWSARWRSIPSERAASSAPFIHGGMANALPRAIGAQCAYPGPAGGVHVGRRRLSMLLGELVTIATLNIPVRSSSSTIHPGDGQAGNARRGPARLRRRCAAHQLRGGGGGHGHPRRAGRGSQDVEQAYRDAFAHNGPALVELVTDPNALSIPPRSPPRRSADSRPR